MVAELRAHDDLGNQTGKPAVRFQTGSSDQEGRSKPIRRGPARMSSFAHKVPWSSLPGFGGSCKAISPEISVPSCNVRSFRSLVRRDTCPPAYSGSKFSNAKPNGSMREWQFTHDASRRWASSRLRTVWPSDNTSSGGIDPASPGGGGTGVPRTRRRTQSPRLTALVRSGADVTASTAPSRSKPPRWNLLTPSTRATPFVERSAASIP